MNPAIRAIVVRALQLMTTSSTRGGNDNWSTLMDLVIPTYMNVRRPNVHRRKMCVQLSHTYNVNHVTLE